MLSYLQGYKTYIAAAGAFLLSLSYFVGGDASQGWAYLVAAATAVGLRDAIRRLQAAVEAVQKPVEAKQDEKLEHPTENFKSHDLTSMGGVLLLVLMLGGAVYADERIPNISGETKYPRDALVRLKAEGVDARAALLWRVYPNKEIHRATNPRGVFEFAAPPGVYEVELIAIVTGQDGALDVQETRKRVEIGAGNGPQPPPDSPPNVPPPGGGKLDAVNALGRIRFGNAGCTATIIGPRRSDGRWDILTAAHCMPGVGNRGTMTLKDGRELAVRVVEHQRGPDVAWMVTERADLNDLAFANLAKSNPPVGTKIWHAGYGVDRPTNREDGEVASGESTSGQLRMILSVSSGDSGGGIFRADTNEVISTVCCTSGMARKVSMYGGSTEVCNRLRPKVKAEDFDTADTWVPTPIPICVEGAEKQEWTPVPIPQCDECGELLTPCSEEVVEPVFLPDDLPKLPDNYLDWRQWLYFGFEYLLIGIGALVAWRNKNRIGSGFGIIGRLLIGRKPTPPDEVKPDEPKPEGEKKPEENKPVGPIRRIIRRFLG